MAQIGDTVFDRAGHPGVVVARNPKNESLTVQRKGEKLEKTRRIGFINGLEPKDRKTFDSLITEIKKEKDPRNRVIKLQAKVDELKLDPRNHVVTRYLEAELAHIMNTEKINPREYTVPQESIRS